MTVATAGRLAEAAWLTRDPLARILRMLDHDGEEARVVGGAVRNALLGEAIAEIDIATTALPQEVMRRAAAAGMKAVPTGIDHGTVTVVADGHPFEVTTLREDVETFGRHAKVAFGRDWDADAARRDFTMNALSLSPDGTIHDPVGGLGDLRARRVRFIGEPSKRIEEDFLRILRFFRFHAAYGNGEFDRASLHACIAARETLRQLSRERVRMETIKLLRAPAPVTTVTVMADTGLLQLVLGGIGQLASLAAMVACETALGWGPDPVRRLGALAVLVQEDADRLRDGLRLSRSEHRRLHAMADRWWRVAPAMEDARALLYRSGAAAFADRVLLAWCQAGAAPDDAGWTALATLPQHWRIPTFPLRAAAFTALGIPRGPDLGAALRAAEEAWIAADFPPPGPALDRLVREVADRHRPASSA